MGCLQSKELEPSQHALDLQEQIRLVHSQDQEKESDQKTFNNNNNTNAFTDNLLVASSHSMTEIGQMYEKVMRNDVFCAWMEASANLSDSASLNLLKQWSDNLRIVMTSERSEVHLSREFAALPTSVQPGVAQLIPLVRHSRLSFGQISLDVHTSTANPEEWETRLQRGEYDFSLRDTAFPVYFPLLLRDKATVLVKGMWIQSVGMGDGGEGESDTSFRT